MKTSAFAKENDKNRVRGHSFSILEFLAVNKMIELDFIACHLLGSIELCNKRIAPVQFSGGKNKVAVQ